MSSEMTTRQCINSSQRCRNPLIMEEGIKEDSKEEEREEMGETEEMGRNLMARKEERSKN